MSNNSVLAGYEINDSTVRVKCVGELTASNVEQLKDGFKVVLETDNIKTVYVDVSDVICIDSGIIGLFLVVKKRLLKLGGQFIFQNTPSDIMEMLELGGFNKLFIFEETIERTEG